MEALKVIGWFIWVIFSILVVFELVGMRNLVNMFPEGRRWWQLPSQLASLAFFSIPVLLHPF